MKISLEKINKALLFIALASLFFRKGNFYNSFIPKPFEIIFTLLVILTAIYVIKNGKIKDFFLSIPKKIWIAISCLLFSIALGSVIAIFFKKIPANFNMVLEFGTFAIGLGTFLLIMFYAKDDEIHTKGYFYALLVPILYIFFLFSSKLADNFNVIAGGHLNGFIGNPNIISKTLLIPSIFFITCSLFEAKNKWLKITYILISAASVALLFWTSSRGAFFSFAVGATFTWLVFSLHNFQWRKIISGGVILFFVVLIGFAMLPDNGKKTVLNRFLNPDTKQSSYIFLKDKSVDDVIKESLDGIKKNIPPAIITIPADNTITGTTNQPSATIPVPVDNIITGTTNQPNETRLQIWPFYLKLALKNPLGFGPNTHKDYYLPNIKGGYLSAGPHNTYLQIWLWGGLLGIFSFLYLLFSAFKNLKIKLQSNFDPVTVALLGILFTLSVSVMFDDSLSLYHFWAILALSLRK